MAKRQEEGEAKENFARELRLARREGRQTVDYVMISLRDHEELKATAWALKEEMGEIVQLVVNLLKSSKVKIGVLAKTLGAQSSKLSTYRNLEKNFHKLLTDLEQVVKSLTLADFSQSVQQLGPKSIIASLTAFASNLSLAFPLTSHLPEYLVARCSPTGRPVRCCVEQAVRVQTRVGLFDGQGAGAGGGGRVCGAGAAAAARVL